MLASGVRSEPGRRRRGERTTRRVRTDCGGPPAPPDRDVRLPGSNREYSLRDRAPVDRRRTGTQAPQLRAVRVYGAPRTNVRPRRNTRVHAGPLPVRSLLGSARKRKNMRRLAERGKSRRARRRRSGRCAFPAPPCAQHAARHRHTRAQHIHPSAMSHLWCAIHRPVRRS